MQHEPRTAVPRTHGTQPLLLLDDDEDEDEDEDDELLDDDEDEELLEAELVVGPLLLVDELVAVLLPLVEVVEASPPAPLDETLLVEEAAPPVPLDDETLPELVVAAPLPEDDVETPLVDEELDPEEAGVTDTPHATVVAAAQPAMIRRCDGIIERVFIRTDPPRASDPWPRAARGRVSTPEPARAVP